MRDILPKKRFSGSRAHCATRTCSRAETPVRAQAHTYHHHAARVPAPPLVVAIRGWRGVYRAWAPSANCGGHDAVARARALGAEIWRPNVVADDESE